MTKGKHGNKEAKKPKKVIPVATGPAPGLEAPMPSIGPRPALRKK